MSIRNLPREVALTVLSYMTKRENLSIVAGLGRRYRSLARDPSLWRQISLFSSKDQANPFQPIDYFRDLLISTS